MKLSREQLIRFIKNNFNSAQNLTDTLALYQGKGKLSQVGREDKIIKHNLLALMSLNGEIKNGMLDIFDEDYNSIEDLENYLSMNYPTRHGLEKAIKEFVATGNLPTEQDVYIFANNIEEIVEIFQKLYNYDPLEGKAEVKDAIREQVENIPTEKNQIAQTNLIIGDDVLNTGIQMYSMIHSRGIRSTSKRTNPRRAFNEEKEFMFNQESMKNRKTFTNYMSSNMLEAIEDLANECAMSKVGDSTLFNPSSSKVILSRKDEDWKATCKTLTSLIAQAMRNRKEGLPNGGLDYQYIGKFNNYYVSVDNGKDRYNKMPNISLDWYYYPTKIFKRFTLEPTELSSLITSWKLTFVETQVQRKGNFSKSISNSRRVFDLDESLIRKFDKQDDIYAIRGVLIILSHWYGYLDAHLNETNEQAFRASVFTQYRNSIKDNIEKAKDNKVKSSLTSILNDTKKIKTTDDFSIGMNLLVDMANELKDLLESEKKQYEKEFNEKYS